jgi:hypothetical protein
LLARIQVLKSDWVHAYSASSMEMVFYAE